METWPRFRRTFISGSSRTLVSDLRRIFSLSIPLNAFAVIRTLSLSLWYIPMVDAYSFILLWFVIAMKQLPLVFSREGQHGRLSVEKF